MRKYKLSKGFIIDRYFKKNRSQDEIAKESGISQWVVSHRMQEYGLKVKDKTRKLGQKIYKVNEHYFDQLNEENAWMLGWILSDGFVRRNGIFGIKVSFKDVDVLYRIKRLLGYTGKILKYKTFLKKTGKIYHGFLLQITSYPIVNKLKNFGVTENKSGNESFPEMIIQMNKESVAKAFIRGIFEGDGSILFDKKRYSLLFQIVGTQNLLLDIQDLLVKYLDLNRTKLTNNIKTKNHFALRYRGNKQALKIFDWIYLDTEHYLNRKYNAYLNLRKELT